MKFKNFQNTIFIKFGRPLAIIFHYTVQFGLLQNLWARHFEDYFLLSKGVLKVE